MPTLEFKGKHIVYAHHLSVPYRTLDVVRRKSVPARGAGAEEGSLIIHGDNLDALKALMPRYAGRVNCIYIDPPYNTGNEGWCYNDNVNSELMKRWLAENGAVDGDDEERHEKWLCMMWPRLQLLRELLAEDGVIFISIDDHEQHRLRLMMDEIFGEDNFYAMCSWTARNKPMNAGSARFKIQKSEEYILAYGKIPMPDHAPFVLEEKEELEYPYTADDGRTYREEEVQQRKNIGIKRSEKMVFSILGVAPQASYRWTIGRDTAERLAQENKVFARNGKLIRIFFSDDELEKRYHPLWANFNESCGTSESGKKKLDEIVKGHGMETVKPVDVIKKIIFHFAGKDAIILDSFAGSGTTAHAVLELNKQDGGNRKFILIECEDYADKVTAERVRRVIKGVPGARDKALQKGLGGTFTFCTLGRELNIESLLRGKDLPDYDALARHVAYTATGAAMDKIRPGRDHYFGETADYRLHMIYRPEKEFLCSKESALTRDLAVRIGKAARNKGKTALVFAPWKFISQKDLSAEKVTFCQLPYAIHQLYGL